VSLVEHLITVQDIKENFYTLAWTTLRLDSQPTNILASGGIRGEIRMFHPANKVPCPIRCCGSGFGIRDLVLFFPGSGINISDHVSESLVTIF
jgi:hypothetical protein